MPIYVYTCEACGRTEEEFFAVDDRKLVIDCPGCGKPAERDRVAELPGMMGTNEGIWPSANDALGVHPDQAGEAHAESVRSGVPTHFDQHGRAIFTSMKHKRAYAKTQGMTLDC